MEIPLIYILISAEFLLLLLGACITLTYFLLKKPKPVEPVAEVTETQAADELDAIDLGSTYIDYLDQALERNTAKLKQQENIENDGFEESEELLEVTDESEEAENPDEQQASPPDDAQSELLRAREQFLQIEKQAAEQTEHEINFWENIYKGIQSLVDTFKSTETKVITETEEVVDKQTESKEKVFYIETQGKKIDGEVNKLKDIISDQENALSSLKKALEDEHNELPEESAALDEIRSQLEALERQLADSKMCMEVLEMENDRLQEEVDQMESRHGALFEGSGDEEGKESESVVDLDQMKEVVEQQEQKIQQLVDTIESLEIEASQAERLKETLNDFTRTSQEMMSCITILEEENERLLEEVTHSHDEDSNEPVAEASNGEELDSLKSQVTSLEEEIIKKDVAYAQLQDEFSSMETEYLAMYEAMHGDNS